MAEARVHFDIRPDDFKFGRLQASDSQLKRLLELAVDLKPGRSQPTARSEQYDLAQANIPEVLTEVAGEATRFAEHPLNAASLVAAVSWRVHERRADMGNVFDVLTDAQQSRFRGRAVAISLQGRIPTASGHTLYKGTGIAKRADSKFALDVSKAPRDVSHFAVFGYDAVLAESN